MNHPVHILLLEDTPAEAALTQRHVREAGIDAIYRIVATEDEFRAELGRFAPDLVLSDYSLPNFNALSALRITRELAPQTPFIVVTGSIDELTAIECTRAGATDYVLKSHLTRLGPAVCRALDQREVSSARRAAERALHDTQQQLVQAQKMEAIGRLAGGVAHDFNNLLNVIHGYGELLLDATAPADDAGRAKIEQILRAAERAVRLTRQLLAFSRRQALEPQVVDLAVLVGEAQKMLGRLIGEDIELGFFLGTPAAPCVHADPGQIEQVLINLAINARDAMPDGGHLTIRLGAATVDGPLASLHAPAQPGEYAVITVADDGLGMDPATRAQIFEPFFHPHGADHGSGLGLSTVYGIVRQHGGFITVDSAPGAGTEFRIYLPVTAEVRRAAAESDQGDEAAGARGSSRRASRGTVLIVEDDAAVRQLAEAMLRAKGFDVVAAGSGPEALAAASASDDRIGVLLTDVILPGMNGRQLADRFTAQHHGVGVVFMSGYTHETIARHGLFERGVTFLHKPFTSAALLRAVRAAMPRRHRARRAAALRKLP